MELRHLRYFDALAEALNFTRAAQRLHVTQSTLSHQIRQLEDELGYPLFDRTTKKVAMTEAGEVLRSHMVPALQQIDRGVQALRDAPPTLQGSIRLGTTHSFNTRLVPQCVSTFLGIAPTTHVSVAELSARNIVRGLTSGRLDLGVSYRPDDAADLWFEPLYNEEMVLVVANSHPLAGRKRIRMVELHQQRLVLLPEYFATRILLEECFKASGAEPIVIAEFSTIAPMLGLVLRMEIGAIAAINAVPAAMSGLAMIPIESPTPIRTPGLLWRLETKRAATVQAFAVIVRKTALGNSLRQEGPA